MLKSSKRYSSDSEPVSASFVLSAPAEVILIFDNSFSMFTGKTVLFRVETQAAFDAAGVFSSTDAESIAVAKVQ